MMRAALWFAAGSVTTLAAFVAGWVGVVQHALRKRERMAEEPDEYAEHMQWSRDLAPVYCQYRGEWVALSEGAIAAHSPELAEVTASLAALGIARERVLLVPVPSTEFVA